MVIPDFKIDIYKEPEDERGLSAIREICDLYLSSNSTIRNRENYEEVCPRSVHQLYKRGWYKEFGYWIVRLDNKPVMSCGITRYNENIVVGGHRTLILGGISVKYPMGTGFILPRQRAYVPSELEFWVTVHSHTENFLDLWIKNRGGREHSNRPFFRDASELIKHVSVAHEKFLLNNVEQKILRIEPYDFKPQTITGDSTYQ